jgi:hypothetical protein
VQKINSSGLFISGIGMKKIESYGTYNYGRQDTEKKLC